MSMHLVGPYMTTTKYNRKQKKNKSKKQLQAQAEHEKWLRKKGVHPDQLSERKKISVNSIPDYKEGSRGLPTSDVICSNGTAKQGNVYSGERQLLGIATMHKSNMVPVFADKKEDAKDIASMRR